MNDRELLELAAKSAGIEFIAADNDALLLDQNGSYWNPLHDDGDALRLAVMLGIEIKQYKGDCIARWGKSGEHYKWLSEPLNPDPHAATRRAIVRASAVIAKDREKNR